jgi:hypothetical protein
MHIMECGDGKGMSLKTSYVIVGSVGAGRQISVND